MDEKTKLLIILIVLSSVLPEIVKSDVGIGLSYNSQAIVVDDLKENCIVYSLYNPFDTDVTARLTVQDDIKRYVSRIEPSEVFLPGYHGDPNDKNAKLANKADVRLCFYGNPLRWPPFYPKDYGSGVVASSARGRVSGATGAATVSSVSAPLLLRLGSIQSFYRFSGIIIITIMVVIFAILKIKKKLPERKKKYCEKCKKEFPAKMKYCPYCGERIS
jgi:hypothetical protein